MNRQQKRQIVAEARKLARRTFPCVPDDEAGACLYLAWAVCTVAKAHGLRLLLQAGTACWVRVTDATDNGIEANVFGYEWHADSPQTIALLAANKMPEIHVWAADPVAAEIIDLTTGRWPAQCRKLLGVDWKAPKPPPFYWGSPRDVPGVGFYKAERSACEVAVDLLGRSLGVRL